MNVRVSVAMPARAYAEREEVEWWGLEERQSLFLSREIKSRSRHDLACTRALLLSNKISVLKLIALHHFSQDPTKIGGSSGIERCMRK